MRTNRNEGFFTQAHSGRSDDFVRHNAEKCVPKHFRDPSVDFNGLVQINIHDDCVHSFCVAQLLEHSPRITPIRNYHLPPHLPNDFLFLAELKTGQFQDTPFDRIHEI